MKKIIKLIILVGSFVLIINNTFALSNIKTVNNTKVLSETNNTVEYSIYSTQSNILPSYILTPLSKKYHTTEKIDKEIDFTKADLDKLNKDNGFIFTPNKKSMQYNKLIENDLLNLVKAYKKDNKTNIKISSIYRGFKEQTTLWNYYVRTGQSAYSTYTGTSEHHFGTAVDFGLGGSAVKYKWMDDNAWKYGFIKSFGKECVELTGVLPEEWHYRWIGIENAKEYMRLKKQENDKGWNYCSISYFRLKANRRPK